MTDEEFIFHEDSRDKKRTAYSANKKPVRNSRKCRFPSDYKTKKEINHMSGEVKSYNLSRPMKWAEFKQMPDDLRRQYILSLENKYNATPGGISAMLGVVTQTLRVERARLGLPPKPHGGRAKAAPEWESFLKYGTPTREASAVKDLIPPELREKLGRYANVDNSKAEPAPCESAPVTNVLDRHMVLDIAYSAGALYALAGACSDSGAAVLNTAAEKLWHIATAVSIGEGKI